MFHPFNPRLVLAEDGERTDAQLFRLHPKNRIGVNPLVALPIQCWIDAFALRYERILAIPTGGKGKDERARIRAQKEYATIALGVCEELTYALMGTMDGHELATMLDALASAMSGVPPVPAPALPFRLTSPDEGV